MPRPESRRPPPGINADHGPGQTHVVPTNDTKDHIVNDKQACWCEPNIQDEGQGYTTHIHHPVAPLMPGHNLKIEKLHVVETTHDGQSKLHVTPMKR